jgi:hypothetical protein
LYAFNSTHGGMCCTAQPSIHPAQAPLPLLYGSASYDVATASAVPPQDAWRHGVYCSAYYAPFQAVSASLLFVKVVCVVAMVHPSCLTSLPLTHCLAFWLSESGLFLPNQASHSCSVMLLPSPSHSASLLYHALVVTSVVHFPPGLSRVSQ